MWFNGRINKDGTVHFIPSEWICTDPDEGQFCRVINSHAFEYIQIKDMNGREHSKHLLEALNDKTTIREWYEDEIDVNDYDSEQIGSVIAPYGDILFGWENEQDRNQLIAECIFETDIIMGEYD